MKTKHLLIIIYILTFSSCAQKRELAYFSNLAPQTAEKTIQDESIKIQQNDLLRININSLNPESNTLFTVNRQNAAGATYEGPAGYRVAKDGTITLPVIGNIKVEGLTITQTQDALIEKLAKYVKEPMVEVQLLNFKITVIGEVNKPSSFIIPGDHINLLEALGMAGDMTVYGKRENVLVIREQNGKRIMKRLNLNKEDVLNDRFFNLMQNDIVYVEPDKSKAIEYSPSTRIMPIVIASISAVAVLISSILRN
ncbi:MULTISPECIES: polysaccharide biosynthesis/export family protein [Sphingobacterium]|jgi:polysaccharide export outer membrane protein|uniref:Polysaccharide biosynthesis/export family protein n=1 Tax=Sphingobacterium paramultivorum TaxID=2886510 RepID=A0A7G5DX53_9SPHI|nr:MULTISPECIES: polysaccharide biosynthesis/export family protein [Sphingobacterium]MCS4163828.1 polysaccharide export outer membrane protein [Sphingobacterium sp. BIGb0116]QMV66328.1 polysaccharide biosynthesis/export family protein [Sphingobacterium paramultivorum]WSO15110.1 polysaccharide biosynthesis/export family protein [Sphingobacterium paramultivorum]